jgi:predicted dehydrogenase
MKIGIIGAGQRIRNLLRILIKKNPSTIIDSIYDISEESLNQFLGEFGTNIKLAKNYNEITENKEIEWVFVSSPNYAHKDQILSALENGKNVFSEKPLAISLEELKEIKNKFSEKGKSFLVSYPLRYSPHYKKIIEIIESGKIGKITSFEFNETLTFNHGSFIMADWRRLEKFSGGHLLEKCCHDFDVTNLLVKSLPSKIASFGGINTFKKENEDSLKDIKLDWKEFGKKYPKDPFNSEKDTVDNQVVILEYRNGVRATFHTNCASTMPERRIYICGTKGTLRSDVLKGILQLRSLGSTETITVIDDEFRGGHGAGDNFLIDELIEAMKDKRKYHISIDEGIKSAAIALGAEKSRKENIIFDMESVWKDFKY